MAYDLSIDCFLSTSTIDFDGDVIVDVINDNITIVAFSGEFDHCIKGEFVDYLTNGVLFETLKAAALAKPSFHAAVAEEVA